MIDRTEARCDFCGGRVRHGEALYVVERLYQTSTSVQVECAHCHVPERWGLAVEEPGTGAQAVPDFSKPAPDPHSG